MIRRLRGAGFPSPEPVKALVHDCFAGFASLDLILEPQKHGAVLLLLVAIEIQVRDGSSELLHQRIQVCKGMHTSTSIRKTCELVGTKFDSRHYDPIMPRSKNDSGLNEPKRTTHFNVKYKGAPGISNRVLARDLQEYGYSDIEWVWIVEAGRRATADEIRQLCSGKWMKT